MYLHPQQAIEFAVLRVVVDNHAHYVAVENVRHSIAANDQMERFQSSFLINAASASLSPTDPTMAICHRHLPDKYRRVGPKRCGLLFIVLAGVFVCPIDVGLIAGDGERRVGNFLAAVVDAAIATRSNAIIDFQFKIARRAAPPNNERVLLEQRFRSDFTD